MSDAPEVDINERLKQVLPDVLAATAYVLRSGGGIPDDIYLACLEGAWRYFVQFGTTADPDRRILSGFMRKAGRWARWQWSHKRHGGRHETFTRTYEGIPDEIAASADEDTGSDKIIREIMACLNERECLIVSLHVFSGLDIWQVSQALGWSYNATRGLWARARKKLKARMLELGYDGDIEPTDTGSR